MFLLFHSSEGVFIVTKHTGSQKRFSNCKLLVNIYISTVSTLQSNNPHQKYVKQPSADDLSENTSYRYPYKSSIFTIVGKRVGGACFAFNVKMNVASL